MLPPLLWLPGSKELHLQPTYNKLDKNLGNMTLSLLYYPYKLPQILWRNQEKYHKQINISIIIYLSIFTYIFISVYLFSPLWLPILSIFSQWRHPLGEGSCQRQKSIFLEDQGSKNQVSMSIIAPENLFCLSSLPYLHCHIVIKFCSCGQW